MASSSEREPGTWQVQLLLPLRDNEGRPFPAACYEELRAQLAEACGGLTAYTRAPAEGLWSEDVGPPQRDDIVVYEVMTSPLDRGWWRALRTALEQRFAQDELVIRAHRIERL